jgi:hypothetical protein
MNKLNILFRYIGRYIALLSAVFLLSGCLGGTVAQQIVRSIATSVADKAMARALDVDEDQPYSNRQTNNTYAQASALTTTNLATPSASLPQPYQPTLTQAQVSEQLAKRNLAHSNSLKHSLQDIKPDPFQLAIANMAFEELKPIAEPLPEEVLEVESTHTVIQSTQLVRVELFNMLIGEEKNAVFENARVIGATNLPQQREWALWRVGTGAIQSNHNAPDKKLITFLIPPEFGKLPSGAVTMVELANPGELNVARYKAK